MLKFLTTTTNLFAAGLLLLGSIMAQQTSASKPQSSPSATGQSAMKSQTPPASEPVPGLPTQKDRFSYALGMSLGKSLARDGVEVDPSVLMQGLKDTIAGKTLLTDQQAQAAFAEMQGELRQKQEAKKQAAGAANTKQGDAFLAANKAKPGVITLPSGLQYKVLKEGTGPKPAASDTVSCNYRGTLIDGTEFDSTEKHGGQPLTFPVNGVIKGWTEALQLMPVGSKWQLFIPPDLAYGEHGAGSDIGPNQTLIFDVELVSIEKKPADNAPAK
jgi:FKBP-type peptidyl-prolyl cis-trans isomerase FklB